MCKWTKSYTITVRRLLRVDVTTYMYVIYVRSAAVQVEHLAVGTQLQCFNLFIHSNFFKMQNKLSPSCLLVASTK